MSFTDLATSSPEITKRRAETAATATREGISPALLPLFAGVVKWRDLLIAPQDSQGRDDLLKAYKAMGYLPSALASSGAALTGDVTIIEPTSRQIIDDLAAGRIKLAQIIETQPLEFKARFYPNLSQPQIRLLQAIVSQEAHLHSLDVSTLVKQLPFPITQNNFFGRFLAGGCETPDRASRHLQLAIPFLVRMRSLFEGLNAPILNFLKIDIMSSQDGSGPQSQQKRIPTETQRNAIDIIHAAVNHSWDFFGRTDTDASQRLACIPVPRLPNIQAEHIDKKRWNELGVALYDWLLFGSRENELLHTQRLAPQREALVAQYKQKLADTEASLPALEKDAGRSDLGTKEKRAIEADIRRARTTIERLEKDIHRLDEERKLIIPIIAQLDLWLTQNPHLRAFRADVKKAHAAGYRIVFSFLLHPKVEKPGTLLKFFELAFNASPKFAQHPAAKLLKNSSYLVTDEIAEALCSSHSRRAEMLNDLHLREFEVDVAELNGSAKFLIAGILPRREDPKLQLLIDVIANSLNVPGIQSTSELSALVKQATGRRELSAKDLLDYAFERLPSMDQDELFQVLHALHRLKIARLSPRAAEISLERFKHPPHILSSFELFSTRYRPNKLGPCPEIFRDRAAFADYLDIGIDAMGVQPELLAVQQHLQTRGIVALVDGTNYHPELDTEIGATGDKVTKGDSTRTNEVWGDYVRPSERLIRALSLRLMEGDVAEELRNSSLLGVIQPDLATQVQAKMVKKFYGITIDTNPDLAAINQLLADLKIHDDKTILVVDATAITDMEQYRDFLNLLEKYQIKIILRTREPFPGIPQVNIQPFLEDSITERILADADPLQRKLELNAPVDRSVVAFAAKQVQRCRAPQADPLNLTLQVLNTAAAHARLHPDKTITEQDVIVALAPIFHLPDGQQMRLRIDAIESFMRRAPLQILGQETAIRKIGDKVKSHILGMRDPTRPLTLLVPGPTGVGKTELMMYIARACDLPFFMVEGAEFSEEHTVSKLVGSPSGYVGPDKGTLYTFADENGVGVVFIDEIEKMHPSVYQALMNFFDKATLTAGDGETISRPGFIIVGASNAGADRLTRSMSIREVKKILEESFVDRLGRPRPELVRRFDPVVMHAIDESAFKKMIHASIDAIGGRPGFVNANMRLIDFDEAAAKLLYDKSREVCQFNEKAIGRTGQIGFVSDKAVAESGLFYDMRHVSRALDELAGESLREMALAQYASGAFASRGRAKHVRLVGDLSRERIELVAVDPEDVASTRG
jgi:MoxR-like ATPase